MRKFGAILIMAAVLVLAPTAAHAKPRPQGTGATPPATVDMVMVHDADGDTVVSHGDTITFSITQSSTDKPYVTLDCFQNGAWVLSQTSGFYASYTWGENYTLNSSSWTGGAASCNANLHSTSSNGKTTTLATTSFTVAA